MNLKTLPNIFTADWWRLWWSEILDISEFVIRSKLPRLIAVMFVICFLGGTIILIFESRENGFGTIIDSMWWAIVTMATVGYGDKVPLTTGGRLVAIFIMLSGVAVVSLFTASFSSIFISKRLKEERGLQKVFYRDHLLVLGWNDSGYDLIKTLLSASVSSSAAKIVLINNLSPEATEELQQQFNTDNVKFLKGDYTGAAVLHRAKVDEAKAAIILSEAHLPPEAADERTVLATLAVKSLSPRVKAYVHIRLRNSESHLRRAGADRVIVSDKYTGYLLANCAAAPNVPKVVDNIIGAGAKSLLKSLTVPKLFIGKTFAEFAQHLKVEHNLLLIGFITGESILSLDDILSDDISSVDDFIKRNILALLK